MKISLAEFVKPIIFTATNTMVMCFSLYVIRIYLLSDFQFVQFFTLVFLGISIYLCSSYIMTKFVRFELFESIDGRIS
jgi:preprotein translocase subunit SecF